MNKEALHKEKFDDEITIMVLQGPMSVCAYLGIPKDHPTAGKDYNDVDLDCHGGLTFGEVGNGKSYDESLYWYGWDYAHAGDAFSMDADGADFVDFANTIAGCSFGGERNKRWTAEEALEEARRVASQLKAIMEEEKS